MSGRVDLGKEFFRPTVEGLTPYQPGKPVEDVQRELGLERVVKLASNEGPFPPFPAALEAMAAAAAELNRYPDGGTFRLHEALAERHGVAFDEVCAGAGADGCLDMLSQAALDPGDEIVCCWPSFPSYVIYARKQGAEPKLVPLRDNRYDLDAMLAAVGPRTKLVYVCHPNNPTGTMNTRDELDAFFERVPEHVLVVVDQAYFEYIDDPDYPDAVEEYFKAGRRTVVLRTFSKIYGLAGLRVGYAIGPAEVCAAMQKVRRPFDVTTTAQVAALASLGDPAEIARRRALNAEGLVRLAATLREHGLEPAEGAVGNFLYVETGEDAGTALRAVAPRRRDRASSAGLRRADCDPRLRRDARGERLLRRRPRPGPCPSLAPGCGPSGSTRFLRCGCAADAPSSRTAASACSPSRPSAPRSATGWPSSPCRSTSTTGRTRAGGSGRCLIANILPAVFIGLLLGPLVDRLSRKGLMIASDLGRLAVFAALPFADSAAEIVALAVVAGVGTAFFRPAVLAGLPNLVDEEHLATANGLLQLVEWAAIAVGPIVGGALTAASGPHLAYWVNAGTFAFSALLVSRIPASLLQSDRPVGRGHWSDLAEGFAVVRRSRGLLCVLVAWSIVMLGNGAVNVAEVFLAKRSYNAGDFGFGLLWAGSGIGLVAGGLAASTLIAEGLGRPTCACWSSLRSGSRPRRPRPTSGSARSR